MVRRRISLHAPRCGASCTMPRTGAAHVRTIAIVALAIGIAACDRNGDTAAREAGADTLAADSAAAMNAAATADESVQGDARFSQAMARHHAQLLAYLDSIEYRLRAPSAQNDAMALRAQLSQAHDSLLAVTGGRGIAGTVQSGVPRDGAMSEGGRTQRAPQQALNDPADGGVNTGPPMERDFYDVVLAHHGATVRMVDEALPTLTDPALRTMATAMRDEHRRRIDDLRRKRDAIAP